MALTSRLWALRRLATKQPSGPQPLAVAPRWRAGLAVAAARTDLAAVGMAAVRTDAASP